MVLTTVGVDEILPRLAPRSKEIVKDALKTYHRELVTSNIRIKARLEFEHELILSVESIKRLKRELGLSGSRSRAIQNMDSGEASQLVLNEMSADPARRAGVRTIQAKIAYNANTHLPRDFVSTVMHTHDAEGFELREPSSKKILRTPKVPIGIHHRWAGDGHDKLYKIGFPIWAVVDDATGRFLNAWVVPSNRMGMIIGYLFLCLVEQYEGMPVQFTTDHGSETTTLFGLINALREELYPDLSVSELPAHVYLRSVHNISIERSWLRLRLGFGDNAVISFQKGIQSGVYNPNVNEQYELCQWLWSKLLNHELKSFMGTHNCFRTRKDKKKPGPSGMSRNEAFFGYKRWGGENFLLPVDVEIIRRLKTAIGGDELLLFTTPEFDARAQQVFDSLGVVQLKMDNVWHIFQAMFSALYP